MGKNLNVLGFLNINAQKVFASTTSDKVDSEEVIKHFDQFAKEIRKPTTVVLDNRKTCSDRRKKQFRQNR